MRDMLLFGGSDSDKYDELAKWAATSGVHEFYPDNHRLQLERWIRRASSSDREVDMGSKASAWASSYGHWRGISTAMDCCRIFHFRV
jgi:hypothetical protein